MKFEDTTIGKTYLIRTNNGSEVKVYRSKNNPYFINADDCKTTYLKESVTIIREVK